MSETTQAAKAANKSATPITAGLGCLLGGGAVFSIGAAAAAPVALIVGAVVFLVGAVLLLDGVHRLVENIDSATQSLLDR